MSFVELFVKLHFVIYVQNYLCFVISDRQMEGSVNTPPLTLKLEEPSSPFSNHLQNSAHVKVWHNIFNLF